MQTHGDEVLGLVAGKIEKEWMLIWAKAHIKHRTQEAMESPAELIHALDDLIRKGYTVSFYWCELSVPAVIVRRKGMKDRVLDDRSLPLLLQRLREITQ